MIDNKKISNFNIKEEHTTITSNKPTKSLFKSATKLSLNWIIIPYNFGNIGVS